MAFFFLEEAALVFQSAEHKGNKMKTIIIGQSVKYNCGCEKTVCLARFTKSSPCKVSCKVCPDFQGANFKREACGVHELRAPYNGERVVVSSEKYC